MRRSATATASALLAAAVVLAPAAAQSALRWDVPNRGALVYARTTERFDVLPPPSRLKAEWSVKSCEEGGHEWRYFACPQQGVPAGCELPGFDDSQWLRGKGMFGTEVGTDGRQRTRWGSQVLCLRSNVDLGRKKPRFALFRIHHDDGIKVWWNGKLVVQNDGYGGDRFYVVGGDALTAWTAGDNLLTAQCVNTGGAQYCDLALCLFPTVPAGVKTADDLLRTIRDEQNAAAAVRRDLFGAFRPPPLLLQGELNRAQDAVAMPPADLRELGWYVAMDLQKGVLGGEWKAELPRLYRLGDLSLRGKWEACDPEGWQQIDVVVRNLPEVAVRDDSKRFVDAYVRPFAVFGTDGRLRVRRRLELKDGKARVAEFRTELTDNVLRGKDGKELAAVIVQQETWRLQSVRDNQDATFRGDVRKALERATAKLKEILADVNKPDLAPQKDDGGDSYHAGRIAIGVLALIKGGVPKDDPVVQRCLGELRKRKLIDTYSLANAMMALENYYAPASEINDLRAGIIDRPRKRQLPPDDFALMKKWADQLLLNVDTRVDPAYLLRFNYTRGERFDHSVNQYGLLGLYSAHLCSVPISVQVWEAAANHLLGSQGESQGRIDIDLVDYRTFARLQAEPDMARTTARTVTRCAGWSYEDGKNQGERTPRYGSMTCAGIAGLAICQAGLLDNPEQKRGKLLGDITAARTAGFGWLAERLQTRYHPGDIDHQQSWLFYYLYGLERAALLSGVALIQDRDWYFEGAMVLVGSQLPDGNWPANLHWDLDYERLAMAILFLKQSTLPVLSGR